MSVTGILGLLLERGIKLKADGDRLIVNAPPGAVTDELAAAIRSNKAAILAVLREIDDSGGARQTPPNAPSAEATGTVSLSQERIWTVSQLHPGTVRYSLSNAWYLRGPLDETALERAVQGVCDRHSMMRSRFVAAEGVGVRLETVEHRVLALERIDLSDRPAEAVEAIATETMEALSLVPFDLGTDFLVRAYLIRLGDNKSLFFVVTHAMIWDAGSFEILLEEVGRLYEQFAGGAAAPLPDITIRYDDYAWWQRERHKSPQILAALEYWKRQLAGDLSPLKLPVDTLSLVPAEPRGASFHFVVPSGLAKQIVTYCKASGVTPFMVFLSGYILLLSRYADSETVVITTTVQGRDGEQLERLIGTFTNHLLLRFRVDESQSFDGLIGYVKNLALDGFAHQQCAVETVIEGLEVDLGQSCLFQLNYTYRSSDSRLRPWADLEVAPGPSTTSPAIHGDLTLWIEEINQAMVAGIDYRADLFTESTIERLVQRLFHLLEQCLARPEVRIGEFSIAASDNSESAGDAVAGRCTRAGSWDGESLCADGDDPRLCERAQDLVRRLSLAGGDSVMLADPGHADDSAWERAAPFAGATVIATSPVALDDEWNLYREVCERRPRVLVTTVAMAAALAELDAPTRALTATTLVVMPNHAHPSVLIGLARGFGAVHFVLHADALAGPILFGSGSDDSVCVEPLVEVSVRVLDRFGRRCAVGIDGHVEIFTHASSSPENWVSAGFRGRWLGDGRIRISRWEDADALSSCVSAVQTCLSERSGITDFHVELRRADTGEGRLLVWVQQAFGQEHTSTELREALRSVCPGFRCPIIVVDVGCIPRRSDRAVIAARLEDPFADAHAAGFELPSPGTEAVLAEIWADILGVERIGAHDSFAELGGSSLQALRVIQRMEARLGWRVEPRLLFFQSLRRVAARAPRQVGQMGQAA